ncbi:hypothetical protein SELMODRAFT_431749 [Selaginella moellendorffii]|uniref:EF-hand domain-containing protein n=1 Tax=Selaginella moellendorffii TaxID=88036 RepID=D8TDN3_SELML|nr:hypothetical protein SELMODRAFT_431749 [Selaginella moellendorffii]
MVLPIYFVLECIRDQLLRIGARGFAAISKIKKEMDPAGCIPKTRFDDFINQTGVDINAGELAIVLNDYVEDGKFKFKVFLLSMRGKLNGFRQNLVNQAFKRVDLEGRGQCSLSKLCETYNARCQSSVMTEKTSLDQAICNFLMRSFGLLDPVTYCDFNEYYTTLGSTIPFCKDFELVMMKHWRVQADGFCVCDAENNVKFQVYTNRIRVREFMKGYDPLRLRLINDAQFAAGLDNAKIKICKRGCKALMDCYRVPEDPELRVCYTAFCDEVERCFTYKELEKTPWQSVPVVPPIPSLAPQRFLMGIVYLGPEKEERVQDLLADLRKECKAKRISVRGFFEDAATTKNASKAVGHVTKHQFSQTLSSKAGLKVSPPEISLLVEKFDNNFSGMVNYIAFSSEIDPFADVQNIHQ